MRIVYRKTILDKIADAKSRAMAQGKIIDHIVLTPSEWEQLHKEMRMTHVLERNSRLQAGGVTVILEEF